MSDAPLLMGQRVMVDPSRVRLDHPLAGRQGVVIGEGQFGWPLIEFDPKRKGARRARKAFHPELLLVKLDTETTEGAA